MFGSKFKSKSLDTFGRSVADYLHSAGDLVMVQNPVNGISSVLDIEDDNSSYKKIRATTRFIFDCGAIWGMAYMILRDEELGDLNQAAAEAKVDKSINTFIKEGLKYVSRHDYDLPKIYRNHKTIINYELDSRVGGEDSPFNKGVSFSALFFKEFYKIKFTDSWKFQNLGLRFIKLQNILEILIALGRKESVSE